MNKQNKNRVIPSVPKEERSQLNEGKNDMNGFVDWNKYSMDELADYLENKWKFSSSGDALAIYKFVKFYRDNKNKVSK